MNGIKVNLKNCYGIRSLEHEFSFADKKAYVVYAQNGIMKSSLAQTFKDLSENKDSEDRIYRTRETVREITDLDENKLNPENVFVIVPYNKAFKSTRMSHLLANKTLKDEYDDIYQGIDEKKTLLINALKKDSGLKSNIDEIFSEAIMHDKKLFFNAIMRVEFEVINGKQSQFESINYPTIFNDKVMAVIREDDFRDKLKQYISTYDRLIGNSTFFKKGIFNHNNAEDIAKNLDSNGFFKASHTVNVVINGQRHEISNVTELREVIQREKDTILDNQQLADSFAQIDTKLTKNAELKKFRDYLEQNRFILLELDNIEKLKQLIWVAYLVKNKEPFVELAETYKSAKKRIEEIVAQARIERTKWVDVIDIFNKRFSVPFMVTVSNQDDVILKEDVPNIKFQFQDGDDELPEIVDEEKLLEVLSNGERRALYILNIIFEVEARKKANIETIFIIDDIADSFDYKNKYAIAEYLKDISENSIFYQIILTHNFDFYRTMSTRLDTSRANKFHTIRTSSGEIKLKQEKYQNNPLTEWCKHPEKAEYFISLIPFMRNLAEYIGRSNDKLLLTSLLHIKSDTTSFNVSSIKGIMQNIFNNIDLSRITNDNDNVLNLIYSTANQIAANASNDIELESKIVLAMAIRLKTEQFMIDKISDDAFVASISSNQTYHLSNEFKKRFPADRNIALISEVNLMTPENIHINSFMYEPILDMSCDNLKRLYNDVNSLQ